VKTYLWIALGGALGSMLRYGLGTFIDARLGGLFPWGTVIVNITGCFVIGFFSTLTGAEGRVMVAPDMRLFVLVGICGGYTTFSSFSLQTLNLLRSGDLMRGGGNIAVSVVACMLAVWIGAAAATAFNRMRAG
jgi:CrcB protein